MWKDVQENDIRKVPSNVDIWEKHHLTEFSAKGKLDLLFGQAFLE